VCTRTLLKSCPNLGSIKPLVPASSDCPEECNTSFTIGGTVGESAAGLLVRLCILNRFSRHPPHSPSTPGVPPQAHLRCRRPGEMGVNAAIVAFCCCTAVRLF